MGWIAARDQLVNIVEGTSPTTKTRGLPGTFKHYADASIEEGPDSRAFWFSIKSMGMKGHITAGLPRWLRYEVDLVTVYRLDSDPTALFEAVALDHLAITTRLFNPSLWGQPTSTIESLALGRDLIGEAEIEEVDGALVVSTRLTVEFRET